MKGIVKWYSPHKGYGYIEGEAGEDILIRLSEIPNGVMLREGDTLEFHLDKMGDKLYATDVKKV